MEAVGVSAPYAGEKQVLILRMCGLIGGVPLYQAKPDQTRVSQVNF
jgi:hypothetical protein